MTETTKQEDKAENMEEKTEEKEEKEEKECMSSTLVSGKKLKDN